MKVGDGRDRLIPSDMNETYPVDKEAWPNMEGVGPDAVTIVTSGGGKHSDSPYRFDLLPPYAIAAISRVQAEGAAKYGEWNWLGITPKDNLNHALQHLLALIAWDDSEGSPVEHAAHAGCRILYLIDQLERKRLEMEVK